MDCIAWIAEEINENQQYISDGELWYQLENVRPLTIDANEGASLFKREALTRITLADLRDEDLDEEIEEPPIIHESFATERRRRRLMRKRRATRCTVSSDEGDKDKQLSVPSQIYEENIEADCLEKEACEEERRDETSQNLASQPSAASCSNEEAAEVLEAPAPSCSYMVTAHEPSAGWKINDHDYIAKVASLLKYTFFNDPVQRCDQHSTHDYNAPRQCEGKKIVNFGRALTPQSTPGCC